MKTVQSIRQAHELHWVGDGFPVTTLFTYHENPENISPFLLMDYVKPHAFSPSEKQRGVGVHPHRGMETVTIVFDGEIEHRDSRGGGGIIGPGDVQWMTAASGLVHYERHSRKFAETGGQLELIQLWVNLPAKFKMSEARYQPIKSKDMPEVSLPRDAGMVKILSGQFMGVRGVAESYTPIDIWTLTITKPEEISLPIAEGRSLLVLVRKGELILHDGKSLGPTSLAIFDRNGEDFSFIAKPGSELVVFSGAEIEEPVVAHGPFVMNTKEEILQAYQDYQDGKMGEL